MSLSDVAVPINGDAEQFSPKKQIDIIPEKWEEPNQWHQRHFKRISKILRRIRYL